MISLTDIFLSTAQITELRIQVYGRKLMNKLVEVCDEKNISSRATTYNAMNPEKYDGESPIHRLVTNEAVILLQEYNVNLPWAEITETEPSPLEA